MTIDPQQRLLLEETMNSWSFATSHTTKSGSTGVFGGCMYSEYYDVIVAGSGKLPPQAVVGSGLPYLVGRLSYTFNFTGKYLCASLELWGRIGLTHFFLLRPYRSLCQHRHCLLIFNGSNASGSQSTAPGRMQLGY